ncbi:MAG: hypothetical protein HC778_04905 [Chamaesiphon sp. CSU_1_12]|nr:hypothetical protein [Chamaesiphon sp. CSU_1_12]
MPLPQYPQVLTQIFNPLIQDNFLNTCRYSLEINENNTQKSKLKIGIYHAAS